MTIDPRAEYAARISRLTTSIAAGDRRHLTISNLRLALFALAAIVAWLAFIRAAIGPAERLITMVGQQRICAVAYAAAFAVNLTGCLLLAKPYGSMGVAIATSAAFMVESALLFLIARFRLGLHLFVWRPRPL